MIEQSDVRRLLNGRYNYYIAIGLLLLIILFFSYIVRTMKILMAIAVFIALNIAIKRAMMAIDFIPLDLEFATIGTILMTVAFGLKAGILTGVLCCVLGAYFSDKITIYVPVTASCYVLAAVLAWLLASASSIVVTGIIITLLVNAYALFVFHFVGFTPFENVTYVASNIALNLLLFLKVAPWAMAILK